MVNRNSFKAFGHAARRVPSGCYAIAASLAILIINIYAPSWQGGHGEYYWIAHGEGMSLTTIGKWSSRYEFVDGLSGQFPILYQIFSDWFMNRFASLLSMPPFQFQFYYGALLASGILLVSYFFFQKLIGSRPVAFLGATIVALASDPILVDPLYLIAGEHETIDPDKVLHVPAASIGAATAQSLAYFLFVPALISAFLAIERRRIGYAVLAGVLLGIMFQTSFLTIIGLASAIGMGLLFRTFLHHWERGERRLLLLKSAIVVLGTLIVLAGAGNDVTYGYIIPLWMLVYAAAIRDREEIKLFAIMVVVALLVGAPLLVHMIKAAGAMSQLDKPVDSPVRLATIFIFFMPAWLSLGLIPRHPELKARRFEVVFLIGVVAACLAFSKGEVWGYHNHQYRFAILLIFPLALLFSFAALQPLTGRAKILVSVLLIWVGLSILRNVLVMAGVPTSVANVLGSFYYYRVTEFASEKRTAYFKTIAEATRDDRATILLSPEYGYPGGVAFNALTLGVSRRPAFIPDFRYIINQDDYRDRLRVFCFLFPEFPQLDSTGLRGCEGVDGTTIPNQGKPLLGILDPALKAGILDFYRIPILADMHGPFTGILTRHADVYGLRILYDDGDNAVAQRKGGTVTSLRSLGWRDGSWHLAASVPNDGRYTVLLAGEDLGLKFASIGAAAAGEQTWDVRKDVFMGTLTLKAGETKLVLKTCGGFSPGHGRPAPTPFYFASIVATEEVPKEFSVTPGSVTEPPFQPCR